MVFALAGDSTMTRFVLMRSIAKKPHLGAAWLVK
jgi:hypothetical protein